MGESRREYVGPAPGLIKDQFGESVLMCSETGPCGSFCLQFLHLRNTIATSRVARRDIQVLQSALNGIATFSPIGNLQPTVNGSFSVALTWHSVTRAPRGGQARAKAVAMSLMFKFCCAFLSEHNRLMSVVGLRCCSFRFEYTSQDCGICKCSGPHAHIAANNDFASSLLRILLSLEVSFIIYVADGHRPLRVTSVKKTSCAVSRHRQTWPRTSLQKPSACWLSA